MRVCVYRHEKTQGLQKMILFVELFVDAKRFGFYTFNRAYIWLNETKNKEVLKYSTSVGTRCFELV